MTGRNASLWRDAAEPADDLYIPQEDDDLLLHGPEPPCRDCGSPWCNRECPQAYEADRAAWLAAMTTWADDDRGDGARDG